MSAPEKNGTKLFEWCLIIGSLMASIRLETWLPLMAGVLAVVVARYTANRLRRD